MNIFATLQTADEVSSALPEPWSTVVKVVGWLAATLGVSEMLRRYVEGKLSAAKDKREAENAERAQLRHDLMVSVAYGHSLYQIAVAAGARDVPPPPPITPPPAP
ncbi:MAG: hypothetical protein AAGF99_00460 [Bacteroidota bacterium]